MEVSVLSHNLGGLTPIQLALLKQLILVEDSCSPHGARKQNKGARQEEVRQEGAIQKGEWGKIHSSKIQPWQPVSFISLHAYLLPVTPSDCNTINSLVH